MDTKQLQERISELATKVSSLHEQSKEPVGTPEALVHRYCHLIDLVQSYNEDCFKFLGDPKGATQGVELPEEVLVMAFNLSGEFTCTMMHIQDNAHRIGTNIIEKLIRSTHPMSVPDPSQTN
jgi:hypothetical protein